MQTCGSRGSTQDYYPFGLTFNESVRVASTEQRFKYASNECLSETGWIDFYARMYQPDLGRFISVDPLATYKPAWTPFRYAFNNPVRFIDPDGLLEIDDIKNIFDSAPNGVSSYDGNGDCTCGCEGKPPCNQENASITGVAVSLALQQALKEGVKTGGSIFGAGLAFALAMVTPANMNDDRSDAFRNEEAGEFEDLEYKESQGTLTNEQERRLSILRERRAQFGAPSPDLVGFRRDHILNRHKYGAGKPGKTEFPSDWTDNDIINAVNFIANDPNAEKGVGKWNSPYKIGVVDGVRIRVDFYPQDHPKYGGKVSTAYPTNTTPNPE